MGTARQPVTREAEQTIAAQIADDYLARRVSPTPEMHLRIEGIVLETIREARVNRTTPKTDPATVITGNEMRSRLDLVNE